METRKHWRKSDTRTATACGQEVKPIRNGGPIWSYDKKKANCKKCRSVTGGNLMPVDVVETFDKGATK